MTRSILHYAAVVLLVCGAIPALALEPLPERDSGIAARYPDDAQIASDPAVLFADDFESYPTASNLTSKWDSVFQLANMRIASETDNRYAGLRALEITIPSGSAEVSNELRKRLSPMRDTVFIRAYTKFGASNSVIGSSHNNLWLSANYSTPGVPADGKNKFLVVNDAYRDSTSVANPGEMSVYIYHPEQRSEWGDYWFPDGRVIPFDRVPGDFGDDFVSRSDFVPKLNQWYSLEMMVKANTPGQRDGRIALWVDGVLIADWMNVRLRDLSTLKMDLASLTFHVNASRAAPLTKYFDNVVIATSYIGPLAPSGVVRPLPPTNVRTLEN